MELDRTKYETARRVVLDIAARRGCVVRETDWPPLTNMSRGYRGLHVSEETSTTGALLFALATWGAVADECGLYLTVNTHGGGRAYVGVQLTRARDDADGPVVTQYRDVQEAA